MKKNNNYSYLVTITKFHKNSPKAIFTVTFVCSEYDNVISYLLLNTLTQICYR